MTLIEIIKTSLLGFSTIFVLSWLFFYLFLKIKKSKNQVAEENQPALQPVRRIVQRPVVQPSPVYVQQVSYPGVRRMNNSSYLAENYNFNHYLRNENQIVKHIPRVTSRPERFVVFNNRQYGFYNA